MTSALEKALKSALKGEVQFDAITRKVYSVDASIYEVEPLGVVCPANSEEVAQAVALAASHSTPIIARGAATGITGGCLGSGLIIDTSRHLTAVHEINYEEKYALCEPGVIQDKLNALLSPSGYRLGADTSTGNRATLGGMLGNNAAGARSLRYGCMADHILSVEIVLYTGRKILLQPLSEEQWHEKCSLQDEEGSLYRAMQAIRAEHSAAILKKFPPLPRRVSGYNLDRLLKPYPINPAELIAGSEGTLGVITLMKLAIVPKPKKCGIALIHLDDMLQGLYHVENILSYRPLSFEMIDGKIIEAARTSPSAQKSLDWLLGDPAAVFAVEFEGGTDEEVKEKVAHFCEEMAKANVGYSRSCLLQPELIEQLWRVRKAGLGLLLSKRSFNRALAFLEDISIPPQVIAPFMERFLTYLKSKGKSAGIYGHVGAGCLHIRPYIDLRSAEELTLMKQMMEDITSLLIEFNGALSGEHGDGLIRSWLNEKMFGAEVYSAFVLLKNGFDPKNLMNPGKIVEGRPVEENLRTTPQTKLKAPAPFLDFTPEGGYELAVDMCNGNGECRKESGTMCPSFQATNNEYDTTRARAQALRSAIHGRMAWDKEGEQGIYNILDLCLECKGCKSECPSQVDMAKMKAEFLHHYYEKRRRPLRSALFGHIALINRWLAPWSSWLNPITRSSFSRKLLSLFGIADRPLPPLAPSCFSSLVKKKEKIAGQTTVLLLIDTFAEYNQPEIAMDALTILEKLGYNVELISGSCCGRPLLSKGMLKQARSYAETLLEKIELYSEKNLPIIGLEPSCILTIKDDFSTLVSEKWKEAAVKTAKNCFTLAEFLCRDLKKFKELFADREDANPLNEKKEMVISLYVHGHCHQKSLVGMVPTMTLLKILPNVKVHLIDSGCCGMAGSFGYEKEHYKLSMQIGELKLFPAVRQADENSIILADGFSCRSQIEHGTGRKAYHLAQFLSMHTP